MVRGIPSEKENRGLNKAILAAILVTVFLAGTLSGVAIQRFSSGGDGGRTVPEFHGANSRSANIVSVSSRGEGIIGELTVEVSQGGGGIFVETEPLIGFQFQYADRTAVAAAAEYAGVPLDSDGTGIENMHVHFIVSADVTGKVQIQAVDGPSAGSMAALLTVAALENREVGEDVVMTGTISEDGSIGLIGGVASKAKAAEEAGKDVFLVPENQYVTVYKQYGLFTVRERKPISYLKSYADNQGWGLEIKEVSTLGEAAEHMLV